MLFFRSLKFIIGCILALVAATAHAKFAATIPVIDMADYFSQARHRIFIEQLSQAMREVGFVAVINIDVDKKILDNAYAAAKEFYEQPLEIKKLSNIPALSGLRGYVLSEVAKGQKQKDYKEHYHIARDYPKSIRDKHGYQPNVWPDNTRFKTTMQQLFAALDEYTAVLEQALAESIGQPNNFFSNMTKEGDALIRVIHYPAHPPANTIWAAEHTDIVLFTVLPRATAEGLQVKNAQGQWIDVVVPDGAFIVNAGDMLQNLTNGVYKSALHRVVCKDPNVERYSVVSFVHARPSDAMNPLPKFIAQVGSRKFANVTRNELLYERLIDLGLHTPDLLQKFAASGAIERLIDVDRASPAALKALRESDLASPKVLAYMDSKEIH